MTHKDCSEAIVLFIHFLCVLFKCLFYLISGPLTERRANYSGKFGLFIGDLGRVKGDKYYWIFPGTRPADILHACG